MTVSWIEVDEDLLYGVEFRASQEPTRQRVAMAARFEVSVAERMASRSRHSRNRSRGRPTAGMHQRRA
jgi:hypothetical protein